VGAIHYLRKTDHRFLILFVRVTFSVVGEPSDAVEDWLESARGWRDLLRKPRPEEPDLGLSSTPVQEERTCGIENKFLYDGLCRRSDGFETGVGTCRAAEVSWVELDEGVEVWRWMIAGGVENRKVIDLRVAI
jgi:hypothetical protein